jgi:hypothetical protein
MEGVLMLPRVNKQVSTTRSGTIPHEFSQRSGTNNGEIYSDRAAGR